MVTFFLDVRVFLCIDKGIVTDLEIMLQKENEELKEKLAHTQRQLDVLTRQIFVKKSEQTPGPQDAAQLDLSLEMENAAIESALPVKPAKKRRGSLKGRKIAFVYLDSGYGREPIPLLEALSEKMGFEVFTLPVGVKDMQNQASHWLQVRKERPDYVMLWGWGR